MNVNGEYLFNSFRECFEFVNQPTNYEKEHNIQVIEKHVFLNADDIKVYVFYKNDGSNTLCLFFKNSTKYDIWKFWIPSENQLNLLAAVPHLVQVIETKNAKILSQIQKKPGALLYEYV